MSEKNVKGTGVDLSLVKKLLEELEATLITANNIRDDKGDIQQYIVETAKATGLAMGLMREASMLVGDITMMVSTDTNPVEASSKKNTLEDLLGVLKNAAQNKSKN